MEVCIAVNAEFDRFAATVRLVASDVSVTPAPAFTHLTVEVVRTGTELASAAAVSVFCFDDRSGLRVTLVPSETNDMLVPAFKHLIVVPDKKGVSAARGGRCEHFLLRCDARAGCCHRRAVG